MTRYPPNRKAVFTHADGLMQGVPHDHLFKNSFSYPDIAQYFFKAVLDPSILDEVDLSTLKKENNSLLSTYQNERHCDLVLSSTFRGKPQSIYFIIEHQSTPDVTMRNRMLEYKTLFLNNWKKDSQNRGRK